MRKSTKIVSLLLIFVMLLCTVFFASCEKPNITSNNYSNFNNVTPEENIEGAEYGAGGLLFMPLEDGTYGVSAGNAKYQSKIEIPATFNNKPVTSIFDGAFSGASNLKTISIPDSITYVGDDAFSDCENLEYYEDKNAFYLGNSENKYLVLVEAKDPTITTCVLSDKTVAICDRAFQNCTNLIKLTASNIKSMGSYAFSGCSSLVEITIPKTATSIGKETFLGCKALKKIQIPASVLVIEQSAFQDCIALQEVTFEANSALTKINNSAFYNCSSLKKVNIPKNVLYVGNQKVNASSVKNEEDTHGAFENCKSLTSVVFEGTLVNMIGNCAFKNCAKLTTIVLPDLLSELGTSAFHGCSALTAVKLPSALTKIKPSTFENCVALKDVTFNDYLSTISDKAFSGCTALSSIVIPKSVTIIGKGAFAGCKLTSVTMKDSANWHVVDSKNTVIDSSKLSTAASAADYFVNNYDLAMQKG